MLVFAQPQNKYPGISGLQKRLNIKTPNLCALHVMLGPLCLLFTLSKDTTQSKLNQNNRNMLGEILTNPLPKLHSLFGKVYQEPLKVPTLFQSIF